MITKHRPTKNKIHKKKNINITKLIGKIEFIDLHFGINLFLTFASFSNSFNLYLIIKYTKEKTSEYTRSDLLTTCRYTVRIILIISRSLLGTIGPQV